MNPKEEITNNGEKKGKMPKKQKKNTVQIEGKQKDKNAANSALSVEIKRDQSSDDSLYTYEKTQPNGLNVKQFDLGENDENCPSNQNSQVQQSEGKRVPCETNTPPSNAEDKVETVPTKNIFVEDNYLNEMNQMSVDDSLEKPKSFNKYEQLTSESGNTGEGRKQTEETDNDVENLPIRKGSRETSTENDVEKTSDINSDVEVLQVINTRQDNIFGSDDLEKMQNKVNSMDKMEKEDYMYPIVTETKELVDVKSESSLSEIMEDTVHIVDQSKETKVVVKDKEGESTSSDLIQLATDSEKPDFDKASEVIYSSEESQKPIAEITTEKEEQLEEKKETLLNETIENKLKLDREQNKIIVTMESTSMPSNDDATDREHVVSKKHEVLSSLPVRSELGESNEKRIFVKSEENLNNLAAIKTETSFIEKFPPQIFSSNSPVRSNKSNWSRNISLDFKNKSRWNTNEPVEEVINIQKVIVDVDTEKMVSNEIGQLERSIQENKREEAKKKENENESIANEQTKEKENESIENEQTKENENESIANDQTKENIEIKVNKKEVKEEGTVTNHNLMDTLTQKEEAKKDTENDIDDKNGEKEETADIDNHDEKKESSDENKEKENDINIQNEKVKDTVNQYEKDKENDIRDEIEEQKGKNDVDDKNKEEKEKSIVYDQNENEGASDNCVKENIKELNGKEEKSNIDAQNGKTNGGDNKNGRNGNDEEEHEDEDAEQCALFNEIEAINSNESKEFMKSINEDARENETTKQIELMKTDEIKNEREKDSQNNIGEKIRSKNRREHKKKLKQKKEKVTSKIIDVESEYKTSNSNSQEDNELENSSCNEKTLKFTGSFSKSMEERMGESHVLQKDVSQNTYSSSSQNTESENLKNVSMLTSKKDSTSLTTSSFDVNSSGEIVETEHEQGDRFSAETELKGIKIYDNSEEYELMKDKEYELSWDMDNLSQILKEAASKKKKKTFSKDDEDTSSSWKEYSYIKDDKKKNIQRSNSNFNMYSSSTEYKLYGILRNVQKNNEENDKYSYRKSKSDIFGVNNINTVKYTVDENVDCINKIWNEYINKNSSNNTPSQNSLEMFIKNKAMLANENEREGLKESDEHECIDKIDIKKQIELVKQKLELINHVPIDSLCLDNFDIYEMDFEKLGLDVSNLNMKEKYVLLLYISEKKMQAIRNEKAFETANANMQSLHYKQNNKEIRTTPISKSDIFQYGNLTNDVSLTPTKLKKELSHGNNIIRLKEALEKMKEKGNEKDMLRDSAVRENIIKAIFFPLDKSENNGTNSNYNRSYGSDKTLAVGGKVAANEKTSSFEHLIKSKTFANRMKGTGHTHFDFIAALDVMCKGKRKNGEKKKKDGKEKNRGEGKYKGEEREDVTTDEDIKESIPNKKFLLFYKQVMKKFHNDYHMNNKEKTRETKRALFEQFLKGCIVLFFQDEEYIKNFLKFYESEHNEEQNVKENETEDNDVGKTHEDENKNENKHKNENEVTEKENNVDRNKIYGSYIYEKSGDEELINAKSVNVDSVHFSSMNNSSENISSIYTDSLATNSADITNTDRQILERANSIGSAKDNVVKIDTARRIQYLLTSLKIVKTPPKKSFNMIKYNDIYYKDLAEEVEVETGIEEADIDEFELEKAGIGESDLEEAEIDEFELEREFNEKKQGTSEEKNIDMSYMFEESDVECGGSTQSDDSDRTYENIFSIKGVEYIISEMISKILKNVYLINKIKTLHFMIKMLKNETSTYAIKVAGREVYLGVEPDFAIENQEIGTQQSLGIFKVHVINKNFVFNYFLHQDELKMIEMNKTNSIWNSLYNFVNDFLGIAGENMDPTNIQNTDGTINSKKTKKTHAHVSINVLDGKERGSWDSNIAAMDKIQTAENEKKRDESFILKYEKAKNSKSILRKMKMLQISRKQKKMESLNPKKKFNMLEVFKLQKKKKEIEEVTGKKKEKGKQTDKKKEKDKLRKKQSELYETEKKKETEQEKKRKEQDKEKDHNDIDVSRTPLENIQLPPGKKKEDLISDAIFINKEQLNKTQKEEIDNKKGNHDNAQTENEKQEERKKEEHNKKKNNKKDNKQERTRQYKKEEIEENQNAEAEKIMTKYQKNKSVSKIETFHELNIMGEQMDIINGINKKENDAVEMETEIHNISNDIITKQKEAVDEINKYKDQEKVNEIGKTNEFGASEDKLEDIVNIDKSNKFQPRGKMEGITSKDSKREVTNADKKVHKQKESELFGTIEGNSLLIDEKIKEINKMSEYDSHNNADHRSNMQARVISFEYKGSIPQNNMKNPYIENFSPDVINGMFLASNEKTVILNVPQDLKESYSCHFIMEKCEKYDKAMNKSYVHILDLNTKKYLAINLKTKKLFFTNNYNDTILIDENNVKNKISTCFELFSIVDMFKNVIIETVIKSVANIMIY